APTLAEEGMLKMRDAKRTSRRGGGLLMWLLGAFLYAGAGCSAPSDSDSDASSPEQPCSCTVGARRCKGAQVQVCEASADSCPAWGPATGCPGAACENGACPGSCTDTCPGGTSRCASDSEAEVCRIGASGCLEWSKQSCGAMQYCGGSFCQAAIP